MKILTIKNIIKNGIVFEREPILFGPNRYSEGLDYIRLKILQRISIIKGELKSEIPSFRESAEYGIPYFDKFSKEEMDVVLKSEIMEVSEVLSITSWNSYISEKGTYVCEFECSTTEGSLTWKS